MKVMVVNCKWGILKSIFIIYAVVLRLVDMWFLPLWAQLFFGMSVYANYRHVGSIMIIRQAAEGYSV